MDYRVQQQPTQWCAAHYLYRPNREKVTPFPEVRHLALKNRILYFIMKNSSAFTRDFNFYDNEMGIEGVRVAGRAIR